MSKITGIIVDDEPLALSLLRAKLNKLGSVEVLAECSNGREAVAKIMELSPDIVFLDIEMPGLNGFDVITSLQADTMPLVIFTTAYDQYAVDAFEIHAVDYILKPIDAERIAKSIERAKQRLQAEGAEGDKDRIMEALSTMPQQPTKHYMGDVGELAAQADGNRKDKKIVIKERDEITLLEQEKIAWVDAAGDYCCLHADGETHIKRTTLKDLLDDLDPDRFKRVHRSTIVNLEFIQKVIPHTKGEFFLELGGLDRIKVSRNYREVIKSFLSDG